MRRGWRAGLTLVLQVFVGTGVHGQTPVLDEPVFTTYGMDMGLSQGTVNAIIQDSTGFIWIGTQDGLNRFDGLSFHAFRHIRDDSTSLSDDLVLSLAEADSGRIWVGTERGGLNLLDPATGRSIPFELDALGSWLTDTPATEEERQGRSVYGIIPLGDGSVVISTDVGLARLALDSRIATPLDSAGSTLRPGRTSVTCPLPEGGGLAGTPDGVVVLIRSGVAPQQVAAVSGDITAIRCPGDAEERSPGLVATAGGDVFSLGVDLEQVERIHHFQPEPGQDPLYHDVLLDERGLLWVATSVGLFVIPPGGEARRIGTEGRRGGLPAEEALRIFQGSHGVLWIGTWNGLASLHPRSFSVRRILRSQGTAPGLAGNGVVAIETAAAGGVWIGSVDGGVERLEPGWRDAPPLLSRPAPLHPWREARVFDLASSVTGGLWIATLGPGIAYLDPSGRVARPVGVRASDGTFPEAVAAYSILVDHSGTVWAGTWPTALLRYDPAAGHFDEFHGPNGQWSYGSSYVWPIAEDAQGRLWVGAFNGGLTVIDSTRTRSRFYGAGPTGLSDNRILSLCADSRGLIWIGTQGGGLNRLDPATDEITVYTVTDGLPHDHVEGIIEDDEGFLWVTTNDGLARFDVKTEDFWVLKEAAGLAGNRFFAGAVHKNGGGELFFGGEAGLTVLDPTEVKPGTEPPPVVFTEFQIHGHPEPLARALGAPELDLEPNENFFTFEFAALDFTDPTLNRYRYRLEGLDEEWIESGSNRVANYTSVPPDRYVFRVAARNADGVWNENGLSLPLRVQTPYYLTWWFRSAMGLAVLLLISGFYAYRLKQLHERQRIRLEIAGGLHDHIGGNLATIIKTAEQVKKVFGPEDHLRTDLESVGALARDADLQVREAVWDVKEEFDTVKALVNKMEERAELMLGRHPRFEFLPPDPMPERQLRWKTRRALNSLYKEALNNILKHSEANFVKIEVSYDAPYLTLRVSDDGKGFDPEATSGGHGLGLMRKHAAQYGGGDPVSSRPGAGTTVQTRVRIG